MAQLSRIQAKMPGLLCGARITATFGSRSGHGAAAVLDIGHSLRWHDPGQVQRVCSQTALGGHPGGRFNLLGVPWVVKERRPASALSDHLGTALGSATSILCQGSFGARTASRDTNSSNLQYLRQRISKPAWLILSSASPCVAKFCRRGAIVPTGCFGSSC